MTADEQPAANQDAGAAEEPAPDSNQREQSTSDDQRREDLGTTDVRGLSAAINVFNAPFYLEGAATFGYAHGAQSQTRRATGLITAKRLAQELRWFVAPAETGEALRILRSRMLVVLIGPDSTGKRALALHLLREVCPPDADVVSLSPAASLLHMATATPYEKGRGYLVADHVCETAVDETGDGVGSAIHGYDAERLADKVGSHGAYLVITSTSMRFGQQLRSYAIRPQPPDPVGLLDRCLGDACISPDIREQARRHVARQRRPAEVVSLARQLVEDPDGAAEIMRDHSSEQVAEWVDALPVKLDLLSVTALALAGSQPEPVHDSLVDRLVWHAAPRPKRADAPYLPPERDVIPQRQQDHPLIARITDGEPHQAGQSGGRRVRFRNRDMRRIVIGALHRRYDYQLWNPVRSWAHELCATDVQPSVQVGLASGLALLARSDFADVYHGFLDAWAGGLVNERVTAAMVLWFMSEDDQLATVALRTAMAWGQDRGIHRAVTSALALGGPLGVRFPGEALHRLCFLALRAKRIALVARPSAAVLFDFAVKDGADSAGTVLATVHTELVRAITADGKRLPAGAVPALTTNGVLATDSYVSEQLRDPVMSDVDTALDADREAYEQGWSYRVVVAARWLVVTLLGADRTDRAEPIVTTILREQPENLELLGRLWADVLCSAPHASAARRALIRLLRALQHDRSARSAVRRFGAAVHAAMPPAHRPLRVAELIREANREADDLRPSEALVSTLLAAMGGCAPATQATRR